MGTVNEKELHYDLGDKTVIREFAIMIRELQSAGVDYCLHTTANGITHIIIH